MDSESLPVLVKNCMDSTLYCSLSTVDANGSWVCPVGFAYGENFDIYFVSSPNSRHMKNISADKRVSLAIYSTDQAATSSKRGVQLIGEAELLTDQKQIEDAYKVYFAKFPVWDNTDVSYFKKKDCEWPFVMIKPKSLFYFDNGRFGENRKAVKLH